MSQEYGSSNGEFEMSVAAAAFAIISLEGGDDDKTKGKREENRTKTTHSERYFPWLFKDEAKDDDKFAGDKLTTKSKTTSQHDSTIDHKKPEKTMNTTPNIRTTTTFSDKNASDVKSSKINGNGNEAARGPKSPSMKKRIRFSSFKMTASNTFGSRKDK